MSSVIWGGNIDISNNWKLKTREEVISLFVTFFTKKILEAKESVEFSDAYSGIFGKKPELSEFMCFKGSSSAVNKRFMEYRRPRANCSLVYNRSNIRFYDGDDLHNYQISNNGVCSTLAISPGLHFVGPRKLSQYDVSFGYIYPLEDLMVPIDFVLGDLYRLLEVCKEQNILRQYLNSKQWFLDVRKFSAYLQSKVTASKHGTAKYLSFDEWMFRLLFYWCERYLDVEVSAKGGLHVTFHSRSSPIETLTGGKGFDLLSIMLKYFLCVDKFLSYSNENDGLYPWFSHDSTTYYISPFYYGRYITANHWENREVLLPDSFDFFHKHLSNYFLKWIQ